MTVRSELATKKVDEDRRPVSLSCASHRLWAESGRGISATMLFIMVASFGTIHAALAQSSAPPSSVVATRPCTSSPAGSKRPKGANKSKKAGEDSGSAASTCIEVHSTPLEVQEYLQARGREEKWSLMDEHVAEDAWTFTRKLEKDELLLFTKKDASSASVNWTSGAAFVQVMTTEVDAGFVRVQVSARFQGFGQNPDRFAPPKESWPLNSNTSLEHHLIAILETHFKNPS